MNALIALVVLAFPQDPAQEMRDGMVLKADGFKHYVDRFNRYDEEIHVQHVPNEKAWEFLRRNIPLFECPDAEMEEIFIFRWWTYRRHVKKTEDGFVITEFLPKVGWARKHNTISCAAGHHFYEGRWLHDPKYLDDYAVFWFRKGGNPRNYSFWAADAMLARHLVRPDRELVTGLLDDLIANYGEWVKSRLGPNGLFWQIDDRDGMEHSISGSGCRATLNSYMCGDAVAISKTAELAGRREVADEYRARAGRIRKLVLETLWDDGAKFFKVLPNKEGAKLSDAREQHGFTPWYFCLPGTEHSAAWKQLMDPKGFYAPYGPTTAEQRHPGFKISYEGHQCQWNGPSWPYSTTVTLRGLANLLQSYDQDVMKREDYFETLKIYTKCHRLKREDGRILPWIGENLNPYTGEWIARTRLMSWPDGPWPARKGGRERGKDYNHSAYCDLVITGLAGLMPRPDDTVEVCPLLPDDTWDYFCLDRVPYHGRILTILWDRTGEKYGKGKGLRVFADGREIASSEKLERVKGELP